MTPLRGAGPLVALVALGLGCGGNVEHDVKRAFSSQHACPVDRITVTLRPDVTLSALEARAHRPPASVPAGAQALPQLYAKAQLGAKVQRRVYEELHTRPRDRTPPPEIAADPARLAIWKQERVAEQARIDRRDRAHPVAEAAGCGEQALLVCTLVGRRYQCAPAPTGP